MSEITFTEALEMVQDCMDRESKLSEWEAGFMESLETQLTEKEYISKKQTAILERVWEKVTSKG